MNSSFQSLKNQLCSKWNLLFSKNNDTAWISFKPHLGLNVYPCYACRDMFVSKSTFQDHTNRRAILFKYNCEYCKEILTFYNRCALLLHARSHFSLTEGTIDLNNIEIHNLPFGMMGFSPHPDVSKLFDFQEDDIGEHYYLNAQFYSPDSSEKGKQVITLRPNDLLFCDTVENSIMIQLTLRQISNNIPLCQFVSTESQKQFKLKFLLSDMVTQIKEEIPDASEDSTIQPLESQNLMRMPVISKMESLRSNNDLSTYPRCPECDQTQACSLKMHFLGKNMPFDEELRCSLCKYVSSTSCSHSAHVRIHSNISPFICPECGKKFETREYLMKHLDDVCFHLAKQVRIRCPGKKCGKLFASPTTFTVHFAQHILTWMQCTVCKECFENVARFSEHAKIHSNLCFFDKVFKCLGCKPEGGIIYHDNLKDHLDLHSGDRNRYMYVFVCKFCRNFFRSSSTYAAHLLKCQKMQTMINQGYSYSIDFCTQCHNRIIFCDNENFVACTKCRSINSFNQNTPRDTNFVPYSVRNDNYPVKAQVSLFSKKLKDDEQKAQLFDGSYENSQVTIDKIDSKLLCYMFANSEASTDTENEESTIKQSSSQSYIQDASNESKPPTIVIHHVDAEVRLERKRKRGCSPLNAKRIILSNISENAHSFDTVKQSKEIYYCKVCDFKETQRDKFQLHIICHRQISSDYQCMDCGECFVVKPSLIKHLILYHKIRDINAYFQNNNCYQKQEVEELKEIIQFSPGDCE